MTPCPLSAVVALSCAALVIGRFSRQPGIVSGPAVAQLSAPSRLICAACCRWRPGCGGFSFASGHCQLFDALCPATVPAPQPAGSTPVEYVSEELTPCPAGWQLFGDSCYLRSSTMSGLDWEASRAACCARGPCADLTTTTDVAEAAWILHHSSRPPFGEYIGMRTWDEGTFIDIDGSKPSAKPVLAFNAATGVGCVNVRKEFIMDTFAARPCTDLRKGYIRKVPRRCQTRLPCPADWLGLDAFCYGYFSTWATWHIAALLCPAQQPGARLASFPSAGTWNIP